MRCQKSIQIGNVAFFYLPIKLLAAHVFHAPLLQLMIGFICQ